MGSCLTKASQEPSEATTGRTGKTVGGLPNSQSTQKNTIKTHNETSEQLSKESQDDSDSQTKTIQQVAQEDPGTEYEKKILTQSKQSVDKEFKILLLGSGESGKSTILKQTKILHQTGYNESEIYNYRPVIFRNIMDCAKSIAQCYKDVNYPISMDVELVNPNIPHPCGNNASDEPRYHTLTSQDIDKILNATTPSAPEEDFDLDLAESIASLWRANSTKNLLVVHKDDLYLMDSAKYFFSNLKRICSPNYMPNIADILRARKKTSGVFESHFNMGPSKIHMIDVGGQRSERKKWIKCFDNVTIIIFCVSLSEYDQCLLEEKSQNRLEESIVLFDSIVNSRWFRRTAIVIFLNKIDVFAEKLTHSPLEKYFPDYTGGEDVEKAARYILWRFHKVNRSGLTIYNHVTQAIDTDNMKLVFAAFRETILNNALKDSGIITI